MHPKTSFLPSDEQIYERSKEWSNFFSRIIREEDYQDIYYDEIDNVFENEEEEEEDSEEVSFENIPVNGDLMKIEKFEASSTSSDDWDGDNLLNETRNIIEERKRKWKESGMDRVLDTFDFNAITDKVGSWLRKSKHDRQLTSDVSMQEVHYENHQYELNSDDSLQSADTAKYILSNRKPRAGSCTKMIIKRFRYVKGKRKELQKKYNCLDENDLEFYDVLSKKGDYMQPRINREGPSYEYDECRTPTNHSNRYGGHRHAVERPIGNAIPKYKKYCDISGVMPLNGDCNTPKTKKANLESFSKTTALTQETVRKNRSRYRKRRSDVCKKHSTSRSSSCNSDRSISRVRPRFRKISRKTKMSDFPILLSSNSSDGTKQNEKPAQPPPQKAQVNLQTESKKGLSSDVTCFLPENIVNSTAIVNKKCVVSLKSKTCQLSPVKATSKKESVSSKPQLSSSCVSCPNKDERRLLNKKNNMEQVEPAKRKESLELKNSIDSKSSDKRIVLYNPENKTLYNESINRGCFVLTEEYLKKSLGKKQAQRFIIFNKKKFPLKFDLSSTVYFVLPADSENSYRSGSSGESDDEDVLNMFGKEGSLVEQISLN